MEQNFQTSFIPKKPIVAERAKSSKPISFFSVIAIFVFITVVLAAGGLYFYKTIVLKGIASKENNLTIAKNRFEPDKITELQVLDRRLRDANIVLANHVAITPIFKELSAITLKSVRYTKFSYDLAESKEGKVLIKLSGQASDYRTVALQSDLLTKNKIIIDPVFSNLAPSEKGNIIFDLQFLINGDLINYKSMLERETGISQTLEQTNEEVDIQT